MASDVAEGGLGVTEKRGGGEDGDGLDGQQLRRGTTARWPVSSVDGHSASAGGLSGAGLGVEGG